MRSHRRVSIGVLLQSTEDIVDARLVIGVPCTVDELGKRRWRHDERPHDALADVLTAHIPSAE